MEKDVLPNETNIYIMNFMRFKILFILPLLLVSGCDNNKNTIYLERNSLLENALVTIEDDLTLFTKSADNDLLIKLSETKQDYVVYTYSENCSFCASFLPILKNYLLETHHLIYSYNATSNNLTALNEALPDVYSILGTPNMSFFKDGQKISELASSRFQNAHNFKIAFESYISISNIEEVYDYNFTLNLLNKEDIIVYFYEDENSYEFYKHYFYPDLSSLTNIDSYRVDLSRFSENEKETLENSFNLPLTSGLIYLKTSKIKKFITRDELDYLTQYEEIISNLSGD